MKNTKFLLLKSALFINFMVFAQFGNQQIISTNANGATAVFAVDIDGDGDIDIVSASDNDNKIAWFENLDGLGDFSAEHVISTSVQRAMNVFATDIDGDGDNDILAVSAGEYRAYWFENTDGLGNFSTENLIASNLSFAASIIALDVDNDNDMDVVVGAYGDAKVSWFENTDGLGNFGAENIITTDAGYVRSVFSIDIDGDGYVDLLSASEEDNKIAWYKNDGAGSFGEQQNICTDAMGASDVFAGDIDGDGDIDVVSASLYDNKIAWYENIDGAGNFGAANVLSVDIVYAVAVTVLDVDGDGDLDVVSASWLDNKISWFENLDGLGNFNEEVVISYDTSLPHDVLATDINADNKLDLVSASYEDDKIAWYKNESNLGLTENELSDEVRVFPNPSTGKISINLKTDDVPHVSLLGLSGRVLLNDVNLSKKSITSYALDISEWAPAIYWLKITLTDRCLYKKVIIR